MDSSGVQLSLANICFWEQLPPALSTAGATVYLRVPTLPHMVLDCGVKLENQTHRKALGQGSNPQPCCCEARVGVASQPDMIC